MKKTLLLAVTLAGGLSVTAQTQFFDFFLKPQDKKHLGFINSLMQADGATAQKPTGMAQRVIAQAFSDDEFSDSTSYKYSGTKGSKYNHNMIGFGYTYEFGSFYAPMVGSPFQFNSLDLLADSITSYEDNEPYYSGKGFYRADNKLDSFYSDYLNPPGSTDRQKTIHSFHPNGSIKEITVLGNNGGSSFEPVQLTRYSYNSALDKITADTLFGYNGSALEAMQTTTYHYNAQGKADTMTLYYNFGGGFEVFAKSTMAYTGTGKLQSMNGYQLSPMSNDFYLTQKDSFGYTSNIDYFTSWESRYFSEDGTTEDGTRMVKHPGTNGLPESVEMSNYLNNSWVPVATVNYTYNEYDNPTLLTATSAGQPAGGIRFYYELHDDGISSIEPVAANKDFSVYPNPFNNNINIDWKGKQQSNVTIRLTNIAGQEVFKTSTRLNTGKNPVSVSGLNSGNYILLIQDADGKSWSSKLVKK